MEAAGRWLIIFGVVLVLVGGVVFLAGRLPFLNRLPGDILLERGGFSFYFPLGTMLVLSLLLTVVANVVIRLLGR